MNNGKIARRQFWREIKRRHRLGGFKVWWLRVGEVCHA